MVRLSTALCHVQKIKFRKGASGPVAASPGAAPASAAAPSASASAQPAANMTTSSLSDIDLPLRYRRRPLSQEEIDHINGGGIV